MDFRKLMRDIWDISITLFKIMIPTLIIVKMLQELGLDMVLVSIMTPAMALMDLPAEMALVLTTTMLTNPYAGLLVAAGLPASFDLTVGQASVMALFMLLTHALPVEGMISRRAGVRLRVVLTVRIGGAFIICAFLANLFDLTGWYSTSAQLNLPNYEPATDLTGWVVNQFWALVFIQIIIILLVFFLEILKIIGVEKLISLCLQPFLHFMNISQRGATIAIVGVTLGLGFGSGLLLRDVATGTIDKKDVFGVVCFINLLHSVFEDTAIVMLLGPSLIVVLGARFIFALLFTQLLMVCVGKLDERIWKGWLTNGNIPELRA